MKTSLKLWAIAAVVALFTHYAQAQDSNPKPVMRTPDAPAAPSGSWWTSVSISPYGAVKHPDFNGPVYGAGLDIGYAINRTVSLHVDSTVFDYDHAGWFEHAAIDETEVLFRADLIKTGGPGKDRFVGFLLGSGARDWEAEDWGFGVGIGAEVRFSKNFSAGVDSRIRAWFSQDKDVLTRAFLSLRF